MRHLERSGRARGNRYWTAAGLVLTAACQNPRYTPLVTVVRTMTTFTMGADGGDVDEQPAHPVRVAPFALERTEVTTAAYQACIDAGSCTPSDAAAVRGWGLDPEKCNLARPDRERHPINCITRGQAEAFCRWEGRRLPTEAEWEFAAAGTLGARYPWGNDPPAAQACWQRAAERGTCPVGDYPLTRLGAPDAKGLADLAGNVWEWTASAYCPYAGGGPCMNEAVVRGGSWDYGDAAVLRARKRLPAAANFTSFSVGVRCAGAVPPA